MRKQPKRSTANVKEEYPSPPDDLDQLGKEAWDSICNDMLSQGSLNHNDRKLIELYARTYSLLRRAEASLAKEELSLLCHNGRRFINPLTNVIATCTNRLQAILSDLRLNPITRHKAENNIVSPEEKAFSKLCE